MPRRRIISSTEESVSTENSETFNTIQNYFDKQQEELIIELPDKKKSKSKEKEFSKQSCKIQHEFNEEQLRVVEKALRFLKKKNTKKTSSKPRELRINLKKRNKLVKIADKSP